MYYELYIDIFFIVNFMMDVCILLVAKKILKCPATYKTVGLGACLGAFMTCVVMMLPIKGSFLKFMIFHGLISILMIKTGLRIKWDRGFLKAYMTVYFTTFLIGGIFSCISQYMREGSLFFAFALISYWGAKGIWEWIYYQGKCRNTCCEVLLCQGQKQLRVNAIWDTGNRLRDYVTGKPVNIVSKTVAGMLWKELPLDGLRYIPYHTIGKREGILPMLVLDEMVLYLEEEVRIKRPLIAICEEQENMGKYEMILNSDVR